MSSDLRFWSPRRDSNPRPSDYESESLRPAGAIQARSGCSRQPGRPASAFLTCRVTAGGMTKRMTRPTHRGSIEPWRPSDRDRKVVAATGKPTYRRRGLMVGPAPSEKNRLPRQATPSWPSPKQHARPVGRCCPGSIRKAGFPTGPIPVDCRGRAGGAPLAWIAVRRRSARRLPSRDSGQRLRPVLT
jgi:hypothetical protein